ncbi:oligosaccharide flippase family protein [Shewanella oncorhynchi]|uniref:oligosaccharide flippase family protein n=1 Tax=Shewanella oncorhynchi TaxID=2726434 RepID=UPI003D7B8116
MKPGSNLSNLLWALSEKVLTILLTLITTAAVARYFGVELFGSYQYAMSVLFVATSLTWLCPSEALFSKVKPDGTIENSIIVTSIIYRFTVSILVWLGVFLYVMLYIESSSQLAFILILTITLIYSEPLGVFRFLLECQGYYHLTARVRLFSLITKVSLTLIFVYFTLHPAIVIAPIIIETMLVSGLCYYLIKKYDKTLKVSFRHFEKKIAKMFFFEGVKLWFGLVCMNFFLKLDRLLLQDNASEKIFGLYAAAFSVLEQLTSLSTMIFAVLGPVLIYRASVLELQKNTLKLSGLMFCAGTIGAAIMYFLSDYFIVLVYGEGYLESVAMFKMLVFVVPLVFFDSALNAFVIKNKSALFFFFKWLSVLLTAYMVMNTYLDSYGWMAGVYGYYAGFIMAVFISLCYFYFYKNKGLSCQ